MATPKKSRKKRLNIPVEHTIYGPGELLEKKITDSNQSILIVRFPDETRSLLASSQYWLTLPPDLGAIPVAKTAAPDEPDDDGDEIEPVTNDDVEPELVA
jgi:hypothetical protein